MVAIFGHWLWGYAAGIFGFGWILQFPGQAFDGKKPEFFND